MLPAPPQMQGGPGSTFHYGHWPRTGGVYDCLPQDIQVRHAGQTYAHCLEDPCGMKEDGKLAAEMNESQRGMNVAIAA